MDSFLLLIVILLIFLNITVIYFFYRKLNNEKNENSALSVKEEFNALKDTFNQSFGSMSKR